MEQRDSPLPVTDDGYRGLNVTAMGLGRFGGQVAAIRFLTERGARVTVSDQAAPETLTASIAQLSEFADRITYRWGPHDPADFLDADLILVSPAIRPGHPCLQRAAERSIPIVTEIELLLAHCPARVIAVTGTVGKTTTATMIAHVLERSGHAVWLGGNVGGSLLPELPRISADQTVVLELSSFQLHWLRRRRPRFAVAVLTNIFPHHLEWHGAAEEYRACKQSLFAGQQAGDLAILPEGNEFLVGWVQNGQAVSWLTADDPRCDLFPAEWPAHWRWNGLAAVHVALAAGIPIEQGVDRLASFAGLPHRLEVIPTQDGRTWINDSKATSPWATAAGIRALERPTWLIIGGAASRDEPTELLAAIHESQNLRGICGMGPAAESWSAELKGCAGPSVLVSDLAAAVAWCDRHACRGETILLSPAAPSFNEFLHYEQRGELFRQLVSEIDQQRIRQIGPEQDHEKFPERKPHWLPLP